MLLTKRWGLLVHGGQAPAPAGGLASDRGVRDGVTLLVGREDLPAAVEALVPRSPRAATIAGADYATAASRPSPASEPRTRHTEQQQPGGLVFERRIDLTSKRCRRTGFSTARHFVLTGMTRCVTIVASIAARMWRKPTEQASRYRGDLPGVGLHLKPREEIELRLGNPEEAPSLREGAQPRSASPHCLPSHAIVTSLCLGVSGPMPSVRRGTAGPFRHTRRIRAIDLRVTQFPWIPARIARGASGPA